MISPGSLGRTPSNVRFGEQAAPPAAPNVQQGVYGGIKNYGMQQYLPIMDKRDLEKPEQKDIKKNLSNWWSKIGAGYSTPIAELLASPTKSAILSAIGTGLLGAVLGVVMVRKAFAAVIGGLIGMALGGFTGFINRRQQNENILDLMRRFPEGATKRDLLADPVYQSDLNRNAMRQSGGSFGGDLMTGMVISSMLNGGSRGGSRR